MNKNPGTLIDEQQLIRGCVDGNVIAEKQLYNLYRGKMMGVCRRYCRNREDAEDVLQEGFIRVFRNISYFKSEGSLEGWIRKIIVNSALEHIRKSKNFLYLEMESVETTLSLEESSSGEFDAKELLSMIHRLPTGFRTVFNLYAIEGYAHQEIAEMLNISEGTSKSQYSRARAMLQKMLASENTYNHAG